MAGASSNGDGLVETSGSNAMDIPEAEPEGGEVSGRADARRIKMWERCRDGARALTDKGGRAGGIPSGPGKTKAESGPQA
jgi:hypothetical protein